MFHAGETFFQKIRSAGLDRRTVWKIGIQLFSWKVAWQPRQVTVILPLPRGTRSC